MSEQTPQNNEETPELSPIEQEAMEHGWKPKDQFDESAGKKWRSAEEFMDRKSFFDKIEEIKRDNKTLQHRLQQVQQQNSRLAVSQVDRVIRELKKERAAALEDGDLVKAEELRDRIDEVREELKTAPAPEPIVNPVFDAWVAQNQWYGKDQVLTAFADGLGNQLAARGLTPQAVFLEVERQVRENFPQKFRNPNRDAAPVVDAGTRKTKQTEKVSVSAEEDAIITKMAVAVGLSKEEYLKLYKPLRG